MLTLLLAAALSQSLDVDRLADLKAPSYAFEAEVKEGRPSKLRLAATFTVAGMPDWIMTEINLRNPHIEEANALGQSPLARGALTAVHVAGATFLTHEAYEVSPRFGRIVKWMFVGFKAFLFAWNVRVAVD